MSSVLYPMGYGTDMVTLTQLKARHSNNLEPEFARRLWPWIESKGGLIGIGGGMRTVQPQRPGFAPGNKSFHLRQVWADGTVWFAAFDLVAVNPGAVHRSPTWAEVPKQGSAEAARWGVHCNVDQGATPEPWHIQPVENDGFDTWIADGRKRPKPGYPIPDLNAPPALPPEENDDVKARLVRGSTNPTVYAWNGINLAAIPPGWDIQGVQMGFYSEEPVLVFEQSDVDALLEQQGER